MTTTLKELSKKQMSADLNELKQRPTEEWTKIPLQPTQRLIKSNQNKLGVLLLTVPQADPQGGLSFSTHTQKHCIVSWIITVLQHADYKQEAGSVYLTAHLNLMH